MIKYLLLTTYLLINTTIVCKLNNEVMNKLKVKWQ